MVSGIRSLITQQYGSLKLVFMFIDVLEHNEACLDGSNSLKFVHVIEPVLSLSSPSFKIYFAILPVGG